MIIKPIRLATPPPPPVTGYTLELKPSEFRDLQVLASATYETLSVALHSSLLDGGRTTDVYGLLSKLIAFKL